MAFLLLSADHLCKRWIRLTPIHRRNKEIKEELKGTDVELCWQPEVDKADSFLSDSVKSSSTKESFTFISEESED